MSLTQTQLAIIEKARSLGGGEQAVALTDDACAFLVGAIAIDLDLADRFPEVPRDLPPVFGPTDLNALALPGVDFLALFERLVSMNPNADTYFSCLASLHKSRLKYDRILRVQPIPTIDQVGPRGLLQYGRLSARALVAFLFWRKWFFDIDNRAGQETGYLFEPIIAHAIGGVPASSRKSPIRRRADGSKGRQVDCIRQKRAYEIKLRVTIAASGQGRWQEELDFPEDCRASGYTPVLIVLDPTVNPKLTELVRAFERVQGETFVGDDAWRHLEQAAGETMGLFLRKYVREPLQSLLEEATPELPDLHVTMRDGALGIQIADEQFSIRRAAPPYGDAAPEDLPEDIDEELPGT